MKRASGPERLSPQERPWARFIAGKPAPAFKLPEQPPYCRAPRSGCTSGLSKAALGRGLSSSMRFGGVLDLPLELFALHGALGDHRSDGHEVVRSSGLIGPGATRVP